MYRITAVVDGKPWAPFHVAAVSHDAALEAGRSDLAPLGARVTRVTAVAV